MIRTKMISYIWKTKFSSQGVTRSKHKVTYPQQRLSNIKDREQ